MSPADLLGDGRRQLVAELLQADLVEDLLAEALHDQLLRVIARNAAGLQVEEVLVVDAAHRAGIRRLIAPADNKRDSVKSPEAIMREMEFHWVESMDQVLELALMSNDVVELVPDVTPEPLDEPIDVPVEGPAPSEVHIVVDA